MWAQTNLHECGWGGEGRGRSGGASCPSALKFSPAENEGGEGAKGKERMLGTPVRGNTRESRPSNTGALVALEVINLH